VDTYCYQKIGVVSSCYKEKFGTPRQAGLVPIARGHIRILPPYDEDEAFRGLEGFSHIWLIWHFDGVRAQQKWQPTVRPPRLGGNRRIGVFASRSPFRPNPLGLSAVKLLGIHRAEEGLLLEIQGLDLIEGTSILDIKPYVTYADAITAESGYAKTIPESMSVSFTRQASDKVAALESAGYSDLERLISQILAQNPRPAYHKDGALYRMRVLDLEVCWEVKGGSSCVVDVLHSIY